MEIWNAVKGFPKFFLGLLIGIFIAVLTQVEVFLFLVFGVLAGVAISPIAGATLAVGMYTFFYVVAQYVALTNRNLAALVQVMSDERRPSD